MSSHDHPLARWLRKTASQRHSNIAASASDAPPVSASGSKNSPSPNSSVTNPNFDAAGDALTASLLTASITESTQNSVSNSSSNSNRISNTTQSNFGNNTITARQGATSMPTTKTLPDMPAEASCPHPTTATDTVGPVQDADSTNHTIDSQIASTFAALTKIQCPGSNQGIQHRYDCSSSRCSCGNPNCNLYRGRVASCNEDDISDSDSIILASPLGSAPPKSATDSAFGVDEVERIDFLSRLPFEIGVQIMELVPDVRTASLVSHRWHRVATDNAIWRARYIRRFGLSRTQREQPFLPRDWDILMQQRIHLLDNWTQGRAEAAFINGHGDSVYCIQHDAHKIVSGSRDRTIKFWDIHTRECIRTLSGHDGSVLCLQYNNTHIVSGSSDCTVIVWDMSSGEPVHRLVGHANPVLDVRFDKNIVVSCSKDCSIRVWSFTTGEPIRVLEGHRAAVNAIHLHGHLLVSASGDCIVKLWDTTTGKCIRDFVGHTRGLACVQFDGNTIVSGSNDRSIKIWNAHTGDLLHTLKGHTDLVRTLCFDGDHLVSGSYDQTIKVWNIRTGDLMLDLKEAHTSWVFHVQIDPARIISASQDRKIAIWNFGNDEKTEDFL